MIGKFEEVVLLATLGLRGAAMPSAIYERLVQSVEPGGREPAFGAVYTTLDRMAEKGLLSVSKVADEKGRSRKAFTVTANGQQALSESMQQLSRLGGFNLAGAMA